MQRNEKRVKKNSGAAEEPVVAEKPSNTAEPAAAKQVWLLDIEAVRACFPNRPQDSLPDLDSIFHFLATTPENTRPLMPGIYRVNENIDLKLDGYVIARRDRYNRIKLDIFNSSAPVAASGKAKLFTVTTVNCVDLEKKNFHVKPASKYLAKKITLDLFDQPATVDKYAESYEPKDDPSLVTKIMTAEVNNMKEIGFNKAKGPYFKVTTGNAAGIHGFFTMLKVPGTELHECVNRDDFKSYQAIFEIMLRCLHAADKQVFKFGKLHLDIKLENFIALSHKGTLERTRVKLIDGETVNDCKPAYSTRKIGSHGYSAPELVQRKRIEPSADVYSLGMVCRILCRDEAVKYFLGSAITDDLINEMNIELKLHGHIRPNYKLEKNIEPQIMQGLFDWLFYMTQADPALRYTNASCITVFEALYIQFRVSQYTGKDVEAIRTRVSSGLLQGFKFARYCREAGTRKLGNRSDDLKAFHIELLNIVKALRAARGNIREFLFVLDDSVLFNCKTYDDIEKQISASYSSLCNSLRSLNALPNEYRELPIFNEFQSEYNKFFETVKVTPLTLDDLSNLTQHINEKIQKLRASFPLAPQADEEEQPVSTEEEPESKRMRVFI